MAMAVMVSPEGIAFAFVGAHPAELAPLLADAPPPDDQAERPSGAGEPPPLHLHERLRGLSVAEQLRMAREGEISERVVLERLYGKTVWEALLRNPRLTVVEVARLGKLGTLPRPLLEIILASPAWLQSGQVRRALLANPRLSPDMVARVLAQVPKAELKLMPQQSAYPMAVRAAAKKLLKG